MSASAGSPSPRQEELFEAAYQYVLANGLSDLSLRPLAAAIGSSPRVLLYLYGSKDALVRALLGRARTDELALLRQASGPDGPADLAAVVTCTWQWLAAPEHRQLLSLWAEAYARSLTEPDGPWAGFAADTVADWLAVLAAGQRPARRHSQAGLSERTCALAVLRGALLDLLATGDARRVTAAVESYTTTQLAPAGPGPLT